MVINIYIKNKMLYVGFFVVLTLEKAAIVDTPVKIPNQIPIKKQQKKQRINKD